MTDLDYFAPTLAPTLAAGAPPRKPPGYRPVKLASPGQGTPADVAIDAAIDVKVATLQSELKADIDAMVHDFERRGLIALGHVWGKGPQYVVGCAALWGDY